MTASSKDSFHLYFLPGWRLFDILRYYFKCRAALHRIQNRFKGRVVFPCKACLLQDLPVRFPSDNRLGNRNDIPYIAIISQK